MSDVTESVSCGDSIAVFTVICGGAEGFSREGIETFRGAGEPPCALGKGEGYELAVTIDGRRPG